MTDFNYRDITAYFRHNNKYYIKNLLNGAIVELDNETYQLLINNNEQTLFELKTTNYFNVPTNKTLSAMIMITNECNLTCNYCFINNKCNSKITINDEEIYHFIKNSLNENFDTIDITFTGGEPLLNFNKIQSLTYLLREISKQKEIKMFFSVITNGTLLTKEMLDFFEKNSFNIQITLDGNKKMHNNLRFFSDNFGTFDCISRNIDLMENVYKNINLTIRINIVNKNFDLYLKLFEYLIKYKNVTYYIDFVDVPENSIYFLSDYDKEFFFLNHLLFLKKHNKRLPINYFEGGKCMIHNNTSITIGSDGNLYKCYSLVQNSAHSIGDIKDLVPISGYPIYVNICTNYQCTFYNLCYGGCPYKNYILNNKLGNICKYDFLKRMNSLIMLVELTDYNSIDLLRERLDEVTYFKINKAKD